MKRIFTLLLLGYLAIINAAAQQIKPFQKGDRIVFDGNSITDGGHYHSYIWLYYMTRFPNMRIDIFNAGIGGDVSKQMLERMDTDVFSHHPNVVTLTFGMNDTGYQRSAPAKADSVYKAKVAQSLQSFALIESKLKGHTEVRKIMIGSTPYEETSKTKVLLLKGKNKAIQSIISAQRETAKTNGWDFVDFNQPLLDVNKRQQQTDSAFTLEGTDRIHPTNDGHMVMAYTFLKAQGFAGKKVAEVDVNIRSQQPDKAENCLVTGLLANASTISFNYLANALPYPIDTIAHGGNPQKPQSKALALMPFTEEFNQELIKVKGLNATQLYRLKIDGNTIGEWSGADYAAGINLALQGSTPQYQQALAIMHLNEERWAIERKLREYYWIHYSILKPKGMLFNDTEPIVDSLRKYGKKDFFVAVTIDNYLRSRFPEVRAAWTKEIALLTDEIYAINKPKTHQIQITLTN
jgi:lysophospholipase L1-like esterase